MSKSPFAAPIRAGRTLSIMPTFRCNAECAHCGTFSSPRERACLHQDLIFSAIDQAAEVGCDVVVFTGGEPTLAGSVLLSGIERAAMHKLPVRIVTNGCWAPTDSKADKCITEFVKAGLSEINFSTGDQHTRFVPLENVLRGARWSVRAGLPVVIMVETVRDRRICKKSVEEHPAFVEIVDQYPTARLAVCESPWMPIALDQAESYPDGLVLNRSTLGTRNGCQSVLTTLTVQANGEIGACCGIGMRLLPELRLGNIQDTTLSEAQRSANNDFLKRWVKVEGPEQILAWAASHDPSIEWENIYAHTCQSCLRIYKDPKVRRVIKDHYQEKVGDVVFKEWLLFHYRPLQ